MSRENDRVVDDFIRRQGRRSPERPKPLELPTIDPTSVTESVDELARAVENKLARLIELHHAIGHSPSDVTEAIWLFDTERPPFLEAAAKLKAIAPARYEALCCGFEWIFLQPYTPRSPRPVADDRAARIFIANTLNRVRTYPSRTDEEDKTPGGPLSYLVGY